MIIVTQNTPHSAIIHQNQIQTLTLAIGPSDDVLQKCILGGDKPPPRSGHIYFTWASRANVNPIL